VPEQIKICYAMERAPLRKSPLTAAPTSIKNMVFEIYEKK